MTALPAREPTIRSRLLLLAAACTLAPLMLAMVMFFRDYDAEEHRHKAQVLSLARAIGHAVDIQLANRVEAMETLALSDSLRGRDLEAFRKEAERFLSRQPPGASILVADRNGQQLMNTLMPTGTPLPRRNGLAAIEHVVNTGTPFISDLTIGAVSKQPIVSVDIPVMEQGHVALILTLGLRPAHFENLLTHQKVPKGTVLSLVDRNGIHVTRVPSADIFVGKPVAASLRGLMATSAEEGTGDTITLEGMEAHTAFSRSKDFGWAVAIGVPRSVIHVPLRQQLMFILGGSVIALTLGALLALWVARRISLPVTALVDYARAVAAGEQASRPPGSIAEIRAAAESIGVTAAALRDREQQLRRVTNAMPALVSFVGPDVRYRFVNRAYETWFGLPEEKVVGHTMADVLGDAAFEVIRSYVAEALEGHAVTFETWVTYRTGSKKFITASYVPHILEDGRSDGFFVLVKDHTDRRLAEEKQALLAHEVDHRAKNLLAVVQGVLRLTRASSIEEFLKLAEGRIHALARAHQLLAANRWDGANLLVIARDELAPFGSNGTRMCLDGTAVLVRPEAAQALAMALHELATNASKYGALSVQTGQIAVSWRVNGAENHLCLIWEETGGPVVTPPSCAGFGTKVIEASIGSQLGGTVDLDWRRTGLRVTLTIPDLHLVEQTGMQGGQHSGVITNPATVH